MFFLAGNAILIFILLAKNLTPISSGEIISSSIIAPSPIISPTGQTTPISTPRPSVKPTITIAISSTPSQSPTALPTEELKEKPTPTPSSNPNSVQQTQTSNIGLNLMDQINNFRTSKGLSTLSTDGYTCGFALMRANEIVNGFNHDGFSNRISSNTLPYPSYSSIAENIAMNSDPNQVVSGWINSPGHNENMSKDVAYGCVGRSGDYYVFEAWKP